MLPRPPPMKLTLNIFKIVESCREFRTLINERGAVDRGLIEYSVLRRSVSKFLRRIRCRVFGHKAVDDFMEDDPYLQRYCGICHLSALYFETDDKKRRRSYDDPGRTQSNY